MERFLLPHQHGERNAENMHRRASDIQSFSRVADIFKQLSDVTRIRIFWILSHNEECVINLAAMLDMSSPAVSHHLKSMCEQGLLQSRRDGKEVYYRASDNELSGMLHDGIEQIMQINCPRQSPDAGASNRELAESVHQYLSDHISERITIDELSRQFLINPTSLKRIFKDTYGNSIAAHTKQHRMELASKLLDDGNMSISEVAARVGYESQSKFSLAFKEEYGELPSDHKRRAAGSKSVCCEFISNNNVVKE